MGEENMEADLNLITKLAITFGSIVFAAALSMFIVNYFWKRNEVTIVKNRRKDEIANRED